MAMKRRGVVRIIEAVLGVFMTVALILMVMGFTRPLRSQYIRETSDLRRLAYNIMSSMSQSNTFETVLAEKIWAIYDSSGKWRPTNERFRELELFLATMIPSGLLYRMEVYLLNVSGGAVEPVYLGYASNYEADNVLLTEAESITYTHTITGSKSLSHSDGFSYTGLPGFICTALYGNPITDAFVDTSGVVPNPPSLRTQVDARGTIYGLAVAVYDVASALGIVPVGGFTFTVNGSYVRDSMDQRNNVAFVSIGVDTNWDGRIDVEYIFYRYDTAQSSGKIISIFLNFGMEVCSVGSDGSCNPTGGVFVYNLGSMTSGCTYTWSGLLTIPKGRVLKVALAVVDASASEGTDVFGDFWVNWDDLRFGWSYENIRGSVLQVYLTIGYAG